MNIVIKKKKPVSHTIKVAFITLAVFVVVGTFARLIKEDGHNSNDSEKPLDIVFSETSSLLIPHIILNVPIDSIEHQWINALSNYIKGKPEVSVEFGRADVITEHYAVEVDFLPKWKEGLGQALHYGSVTGLIPVLALITVMPPDKELLKQIESLCTSKGAKVILLLPKS